MVWIRTAVFRAAKAIGAIADQLTMRWAVVGKSLQRTGQVDRMKEAHAVEVNRAAAVHQARVAAAPNPVAQSRSPASAQRSIAKICNRQHKKAQVVLVFET